MIYSFKASGNITASVFVTRSTTADHKVAEATAGSICTGVSQAGTRRVPYGSLDSDYCAADGEDIEVFGVGEECWLWIIGTVAAGDRLKASTNGKAIATTTNLDEYGAIATESGVSGQLIRVYVTGPMQISA